MTMANHEFRDIIYRKGEGFATIAFNRPERLNALGGAMAEETQQALADAASDREVRVVIITGEGRAFCAGADVRNLTERAGEASAFDRRQEIASAQSTVRAIRAVEKPIIAAVNGPAAGGGCDFALACDIRIAADTARFGEVFARIGLFPGTGGCYLLPRVVGVAKALELIWSGETIDAEEALRIGLVAAVVPAGRLMDETRRFAQKFVDGPPLAIALAKAALYRGLDMSMDNALSYAATAESITLTSEDHKEGTRAFLEKRRPVFRGK